MINASTRRASSPAVKLGQPDHLLLLVVGTLILIGLEVVFSSTFALALGEHDNVFHYLLMQGLWAVIGSALLVVFMKIDYHLWLKLSPILVVLAIISLILVLLPFMSVAQYGAARWIRLGPLPAIQPSEFVKLAIVIGLASWFSGPAKRTQTFKDGLLPFVVFLALITVLIMEQPDMGTTLVVTLTATTMFFLAGADLRLIFAMGGVGFAGVIAVAAGASYRVSRFQSFLDPWQDPSGVGYHIIQLLIALGSGGLFGLGVGASRQKFSYVPGAHTDGVFAIIGEEMGFVGCVVILALFSALLYRGARIAQRAPDSQGALLACGIIAWFGFQALINVAGITRSLPLTGIPLPFISYGGSALAATMAAVGILLNISRQAVPEQEPADNFDTRSR